MENNSAFDKARKILTVEAGNNLSDKIRKILNKENNSPILMAKEHELTDLQQAYMQSIIALSKNPAPDRNKLRPYQQEIIDKLKDKMKNGETVVFEHGMRYGKTEALKQLMGRVSFFGSTNEQFIYCERGKKKLRKRKIITRPYNQEMQDKIDNNFHGHLTNGGKTVLIFTTRKNK